MKKMLLKKKRKLCIASLVAAAVLFCAGISIIIGMSAKKREIDREQTRYVKTLGYDKVNATLKSNEVLSLTNQMNNGEISPEKFNEKFAEIGDLSQDKFINDYASAEEQAKYASMSEKAQEYSTAALAGGLSVSGLSAPLVVLGIGAMPLKFEIDKEEERIEREAQSKGGISL